MKCCNIIHSKSLVWLMLGIWGLSCHPVQAQNFAYSQYWNSPFTSNPAFMGTYEQAQVWGLYRYQYFDGGNPITSFFISGAYPLFAKEHEKPWANIGLSFLRDTEANFINSNGLYVSWANSVQGKRLRFTLAGQGGLIFQQASLENALTSSIIQQGLPDAGSLMGSDLSFGRQSYSTWGIGALWEYFDIAGVPRFRVGLAGFHLNKPEIGFLSGLKRKARPGISSQAQLYWYVSPHLNLRPNLQLLKNGGFSTLQVGSWLDLNANLRGPWGAHKKGSVSLGLWYHSNQALIWGLQYQDPRYDFTLTWDAPLNSQEGAWLGTGAIEFALKIKFKRKRNERIKPVEVPDIDPESLEVVLVPKLDTHTIAVSDTVNIRAVETASIAFPTKVVRFDLAQKELTPTSIQILHYLAQLLEMYPLTYIDVEGYSCNLGQSSHNQYLSQERAMAVKDFLIKQGIEPERIHIQAWGDANPMVPNLNEANRRLNRRVEIKPKSVE